MVTRAYFPLDFTIFGREYSLPPVPADDEKELELDKKKDKNNSIF